MLWDLIQTWHDPQRDSGSLARFATAYGTPLQRLIELHERADACGRRRIEDGFYDVLSWLIDARPVHLGAAMRNARWAWFEKRAAEWFAVQRARLVYEDKRWPVPVRSLALDGLDGYELIVLETGYELWLESRQMRHCVETFVQDCVKGAKLFASVRLPDAARPKATASFERVGDRWQLGEVRGYANRPAPGAVAAAVRAVASNLL
jgi:hypothetical protein